MTNLTICRYCRRGIVCIDNVWVHIYTNDRRCDSLAVPLEAES